MKFIVYLVLHLTALRRRFILILLLQGIDLDSKESFSLEPSFDGPDLPSSFSQTTLWVEWETSVFGGLFLEMKNIKPTVTPQGGIS